MFRKGVLLEQGVLCQSEDKNAIHTAGFEHRTWLPTVPKVRSARCSMQRMAAMTCTSTFDSTMNRGTTHKRIEIDQQAGHTLARQNKVYQ